MSKNYFLILTTIILFAWQVDKGFAQCDAKFKATVNVSDTSCDFKNQSAGGMTHYYWDFGDGTYALDMSKKDQYHRYKQPGIYTVILTTYDTAAPKPCVAEYYEDIVIGTSPETNQAAFDATVKDLTVTLTNKSTGKYQQIFWSFGDGSFSDDAALTEYTYAESGVYLVSLTILDTTTGMQSIAKKIITIGDTNDCRAFFYPGYIDSASNKVYFINKSTGNITDYYWDFGDGHYSKEEYPVHAYAMPGVYKVSLSIRDDGGTGVTQNKSYYERWVYVNIDSITCESDFTYVPDLSAGIVHFYDKSQGKNLSRYLWRFGDGQVSTKRHPKHLFKKKGFYEVCFTAWNITGDCYYTKCKTVYVGNKNAIHANFGHTKRSNEVSFLNECIGSVDTYYWKMGESGAESNAANPKYTYTGSDYYLVYLIVTKNGEYSDAVKIINTTKNTGKLKGMFLALPYEKASKASGDSNTVRFKGAVTADPSRVAWDFGDGTSDSCTFSPVHTYSDTGTYNVCMTVSDELTGQEDSYCYNVHVGSDMITVETIRELKRLTLDNYPNPVQSSAVVVYSVPVGIQAEISIYNMLGEKVKVISEGVKSPGTRIIPWNRGE